MAHVQARRLAGDAGAAGDVGALGALLAASDRDSGAGPVGAGALGAEDVDIGAGGGDGAFDVLQGEASNGAIV